MRIDAVVLDASPIIVLFRSNLQHLLPRLFQHIVVPDVVWDEVASDGQRDNAAVGLAAAAWPIRVAAPTDPRVSAYNLGAGETGVISYALA